VTLTTLGVRFVEGKKQRLIEYGSMAAADLPDDWWRDKSSVDRVRLRLKDDSVVEIGISGGRDGGRDVYDFLRFFRRVIDFLDRRRAADV
jgi:hypothetical protein